MSLILGIFAAYTLIAVIIAFGFGKPLRMLPLTMFWLPIAIYFLWPKKGALTRSIKKLFGSNY